MKKPELLAPAGDLEKLKIAVIYGADAVYFGGEDFSLRSGSGILGMEDIAEGVDFAHEHGAKAYMTLNIYAHNEDLSPLRHYLKFINDIPIDAFLVSDPGVLDIVKEVIPEATLHLSTQANATNAAACAFWVRQGVSRIVLARELSLTEIRDIRDALPEKVELEAFVHGAMCISYSGRCLLSNFMSGRDANKGLCSHPCRWKYSLVEEKRPGEYYPVEEDGRGTYFMNSNDLVMIDHIPELIEAGVSSFKIEGRMKSMYYVATCVRAYRAAIDGYCEDPEGYEFDFSLLDELNKVSHRRPTTGFFFDKPDNSDQNYDSTNYIKEYSFVGKVLEYDAETGFAKVEQRNKMDTGDTIEIFGPGKSGWTQKLEEMYDWETGEPLDSAPHPQQILKIRMDGQAGADYIIRKPL